MGNFLCIPSQRLLFHFSLCCDSFKSVRVSSWFYSEQKAKLGGFLDKNKYNNFVCALDNFAVKFGLLLKLLGSPTKTI